MRWRPFMLLAIVTVLVSGSKDASFLGPKSTNDRLKAPEAAGSVPAAKLVHLAPGSRLEGEEPPAGWSHLVIKSLPRLATGDLDTVSSQAFETAGRVRLAIAADVRPAPAGQGTFLLHRVGAGLCAPAADGLGDVVVTPTSVDGSKGPWTTKQRLVLAATSLDLARVSLGASTSNFALIRMPVTFLVAGSHRRVSVCYAVLGDPQNGTVRTFAWMENPDAATEPAQPTKLRLLSASLFDCPIDIQARRLLGTIPVTWSFAVTNLPPGTDLDAPPGLAPLLAATSAPTDSGVATQIQEVLTRLLEAHP
jgi:hypothetical protein